MEGNPELHLRVVLELAEVSCCSTGQHSWPGFLRSTETGSPNPGPVPRDKRRKLQVLGSPVVLKMAETVPRKETGRTEPTWGSLLVLPAKQNWTILSSW